MNLLRTVTLSTLMLFFTTHQVFALSPPRNSTPMSIKIKDSITVKLSEVDDIGFVILWNGNGVNEVVKCEWKSGVHGQASENITPFLTKGINYIIFALYNKHYAGTGLLSGGKWSWSPSISENGTTFWGDPRGSRDNNPEIADWYVIKAEVLPDGFVQLSKTIPSNDLDLIKSGLKELEKNLNDNVGYAVPF